MKVLIENEEKDGYTIFDGDASLETHIEEGYADIYIPSITLNDPAGNPINRAWIGFYPTYKKALERLDQWINNAFDNLMENKAIILTHKNIDIYNKERKKNGKNL